MGSDCRLRAHGNRRQKTEHETEIRAAGFRHGGPTWMHKHKGRGSEVGK